VVRRAAEVVDMLTRKQFLARAVHPFTRALIADSPSPRYDRNHAAGSSRHHGC
jgi:hypothetical protein